MPVPPVLKSAHVYLVVPMSDSVTHPGWLRGVVRFACVILCVFGEKGEPEEDLDGRRGMIGDLILQLRNKSSHV